MTDVRIFIQARMSSVRFPGKILAPFAGAPLLAAIVSRLASAGLAERAILLTSTDSTDDPLALYAEAGLGLQVFRGSLGNVVRRFQDCARVHSSEWVVRICGDSPVIDGDLVAHMVHLAERNCDLVSNVVNRSFPCGQSVECLRTSSLLALDADALPLDEQEHVTLHYYRHADRYRLRSVTCNDPTQIGRRLVVDTLEDLRALEAVLRSAPETVSGFSALARVQF